MVIILIMVTMFAMKLTTVVLFLMVLRLGCSELAIWSYAEDVFSLRPWRVTMPWQFFAGSKIDRKSGLDSASSRIHVTLMEPTWEDQPTIPMTGQNRTVGKLEWFCSSKSLHIVELVVVGRVHIQVVLAWWYLYVIYIYR